jgi:hypothetical protein
MGRSGLVMLNVLINSLADCTAFGVNVQRPESLGSLGKACTKFGLYYDRPT